MGRLIGEAEDPNLTAFEGVLVLTILVGACAGSFYAIRGAIRWFGHIFNDAFKE